MKVTEAVCEELHRQGFSELLADGGFDVAWAGPSGHQGGTATWSRSALGVLSDS
jgi:hypothetical protein